MATWLRTSAEKARAAMETATERIGRTVGLEDYETLFAADPETGYAVRSVALLRCVGAGCRAQAKPESAAFPPVSRHAPSSEDTKSLQAALEKYKRAVESSVQGGVMELGLKGFSQALIEIASRDSIKVRAVKACAAKRRAAADVTPRRAAGAQHGRCVLALAVPRIRFPKVQPQLTAHFCDGRSA